MELENKVIQEKMCQVITRFYYSDSKEINLPPNEKLISQVYVPWRKDYYVVTKEFKDYDEIKIEECNFISKVRALTKEHESLPFSQKYPILALEIENAAKEGKHYIWYALTEKMEEDLRAGYFTEDNLKTIKEHDDYKNKWAKENNIPLKRIPYKELKNLNLDLILNEEYFIN